MKLTNNYTSDSLINLNLEPMTLPQKIIQSRSHLTFGLSLNGKGSDEGGCGVVGFASTKALGGKHLLVALNQMKNRGNGKGGGVAILGLSADQLGVSTEVLKTHYILQIAYLDLSVKEAIEDEFVFSKFDVETSYKVDSINDHKSIGLEVKPPAVYRYFCRIKENELTLFMNKNKFHDVESETKKITQKAKDEFVYQNSFALNTKYYASLGEKQAFVLSHSKNLLVFKIVGYADHVIKYYKLDEFVAHVWIGHHRYPTKGTVWHPGGAHPFIGLNEALVHNGDFSNYHSVSEYLAERNIYSLFLTDTEVSAYLVDLYSRVYDYPMEYVIEALAPTTERDFTMLDTNRQKIYSKLQATHMRGSPDGPWFFIIGKSEPSQELIQLIGITDTSMLRPQVFALQENEETIGLIASERQAIDAILRSIHLEDKKFPSKADIYWNARGGSYTDGGAFIFSIKPSHDGGFELVCTDKFGKVVRSPQIEDGKLSDKLIDDILAFDIAHTMQRDTVSKFNIGPFCKSIVKRSKSLDDKLSAVNLLTHLLDRIHNFPNHYSGWMVHHIEKSLFDIFRSFEYVNSTKEKVGLIDFNSRMALPTPSDRSIDPTEIDEKILVIDAKDFDEEGKNSVASLIVKAYEIGWRRVIVFDLRGHRFCGAGLGSDSSGFRLDLYGNPGDYLASGLDGAEIYVHSAAQDQVGQIMKSGKLVIYGDVGQTFMYGAKGGEAYVLGNAAGRPLINAAGSPRVVINGTCLDYLAESFMAGDPTNGGGFVILNSIKFDNKGQMVELDIPYPGSNLFSLGSGGAIYIRDPRNLISDNQLNGGQISQLNSSDLIVVEKYLYQNTKHFKFLSSQPLEINGNGMLYTKVEKAE